MPGRVIRGLRSTSATNSNRFEKALITGQCRINILQPIHINFTDCSNRGSRNMLVVG
jgi:hypothetical protein